MTDKLTVTDADKRATQDIFSAVGSYHTAVPPKPYDADEFLALFHDAFARHRELGRLQGLEEAARELDRLDGFGEWQEAATAIRALKG